MSKRQKFINKLKGPHIVRQELLEAKKRILILTLSDIRILMEGADEHRDALIIPTCLDLIDGCFRKMGRLNGDSI